MESGDAYEPFAPKPPVGVMPARIWRTKRVQELLAAIQRQNEHAFPVHGIEMVAGWCRELVEHIDWLGQEVKRDPYKS